MSKNPIYIFDEMDNLLAITVGYSEAIFEESIENKGATLQIIFPANDNDAEHLVGGNQVAFKDLEDNLRLFTIREVDDEDGSSFEKTVMCLPAMDELDDAVVENQIPQDKDAGLVITNLLYGTRWQKGNIAELGLNSTSFYYEYVKQSLIQVSTVWGGELIDRITVDEIGISGRFIDLVFRRGADKGKIFEADKDIESITRTVLYYPKTALYGRGASIESGEGYSRRITFEDVVWSVVNGNPVDKPAGQKWIGDPDALLIHGIDNNGTKIHRFGQFEDQDETNPAKLLSLTYQQLQIAKNPMVRYKMSVNTFYGIAGYEHEQVLLGDTGMIINKNIKPEILLESRVISLKYDIGDPTNGEVIIGNFLDIGDDQKKIDWAVDKVAEGSGGWDAPPEIGDGSFPDDSPPVPSNVEVDGLFRVIQLSWDYDPSSYIGAYEVYASQIQGFIPDVSNLVYRGKTGGYVHNAETNQIWYFRLRTINTHGTASLYTVEFMGETSRIDLGEVAPGVITGVEIQDFAISTSKILDNAINSAKIVAGAVTELKLGLGSVTNTKLGALAVDAAKLADGSVINTKILNGAVDNVKLAALSVDAGKLVNGSVTNTKILDNAITSLKIAAGEVKEAQIATDAITTLKILDGAIANAKIAAGAITEIKLGAGAVTNTKLANLAIDAAKLADSAVTATKIASLAVGTAAIQDLAVTSAKVQRLEADKITVGLGSIFANDYDPTTKETPTGAQEKANIAENSAKIEGGWSNNYLVSSTIIKFLTNPDGSELSTVYSYEVQGVTTGTGTVSTAIAVFKSIGTGWELEHVYRLGTTSNHPEFVLFEGKPAIKTGHNTTYNVSVHISRFAGREIPSNITQTLWKYPGTTFIDGGNIYTNTVTANQIAALTITASQIAAVTITGAKIVTNTITATQIATSTITSTQMVAGTITAASGIIGDAAITAAKIESLAVGTAAIANGAITNAKIGLLAVGTAQIADAAINSAKIANLAVGNAAIANGAIDNAKIVNLDAGKITTGLLNAARVQIGAGTQFADGFDPTLIAIGGRNLILDSVVRSVPIGTGSTRVSESLVADQEYTFSADYEIISGVPTSFLLYPSGSSNGSYQMFIPTRPKGKVKMTFTPTVTQVPNLNIYSGNNNAAAINVDVKFTNLKLEKGNKVTDYTPAPEDQTAYVDGAVEPANTRLVLWQYADTTFIDGGDIYTNTITANAIAAGTITAAEIKGLTITAAELAADSIIASKIKAGEITAGKLAANSVIAANIQAGQIDTTKIVTAGLSADIIKFGVMSGDRITTNTLHGNRITAGTVNANVLAANSVIASDIKFTGKFMSAADPTKGLQINGSGDVSEISTQWPGGRKLFGIEDTLPVLFDGNKSVGTLKPGVFGKMYMHTFTASIPAATYTTQSRLAYVFTLTEYSAVAIVGVLAIQLGVASKEWRVYESLNSRVFSGGDLLRFEISMSPNFNYTAVTSSVEINVLIIGIR